MKRLFLILVLIVGLTSSMQARDTYSRNIADLPQAAQTVLNKCFKAKISVIKIDKNKMGVVDDYEVILTDGTEVEFDRNGNWEKVETSYDNVIPVSLIPQKINDYITANHKGLNVVGIEKDRRKIEIELNNGLELDFSLNGDFIKYDR